MHSSMDYKVVICSHKRVDTLRKKTLATLQLYNIPLHKIFIFVEPEQVETYKIAFPSYNVLPGELGLANNRNKVTEYFAEDEYLLMLDDDLMGFYHCNSEGRCRKIPDLDSVVKKGFEEANKYHASLWGFFPVCNSKWMSNTVCVGLTFIYGCAFGLINKKDIRITIDIKEDYERTLLFYVRDGCTVRLNSVSPNQSYCKGKGGLSEVRTLDKEREECLKLMQKYPQYASQKFRKDGSRYDITFPRSLYRKVPF